MRELTYEQERFMEALALAHGGVKVRRGYKDGSILCTTPEGRRFRVTEGGTPTTLNDGGEY